VPPGETLDRGLPILCRDDHAGAADGSAVPGHGPTRLPRRVRSHLTTAVPLTDPPARYRAGPWPVPHDTILDFTSTPAGYGWLDELAAAAADRAGSVAGPTVIGHSDWYARNLRLADGVVVAAYDWDSVIADTEPVIAGSFTTGNATGPGAPTPGEVGRFLTN